jgi:3-phosphoglycerate kinase
MGVCEFSNYQVGTEKIVKLIDEIKNLIDSYIYLAGGDTYACVKNFSENKIIYDFFTTNGKISGKLLDNEVLYGLENIANK